MSRTFQTDGAPHFSPPVTVQRVMRDVLIGLVPGIVACAWYFGPGIVIQIALAVIFALLFETLMLKARGRDPWRFLTDLSAVVTAVLFALCLPPLTP